MSLRLSLLLLLGLAFTWACGGSQKATAGKSDTQNATAAYRQAMEEFHDEDCIAAEPLFKDIAKKYPYSRYAAYAELRVADCQMMQGKNQEAVVTYEEFIRKRPTHNDVPYATFKIAEAHYKQIPDTWLLSPPAEERDQMQTHKAVRQLKRYLELYPKDNHVQRAQTMLREALTLLAGHEMYAARFYWKQDKPKAVIGRTLGVIKNFRGASVEDEALWMLAESYRKLNMTNDAKAAYTDLSTRFPKSSYTSKARKSLEAMR